MPQKAPRICRNRQCRNATHNRNGFCDDCQGVAVESRKGFGVKRYGDRWADHRGKSTARGYDWKWRKLRNAKISRNPLCEMCGKAPATQVHHKIPIAEKPNLRLNWDNIQSLCTACHMALHDRVAVQNIPSFVKPSGIPVTIVCGPPGSGKSYYVRQQAEKTDVVIDLDDCRCHVSGKKNPYLVEKVYLNLALKERNRRLAMLADATGDRRAWFVVGAPSSKERDRWRKILGADQVIILAVDEWVCLCRIGKDERRTYQVDKFSRIIQEWWKKYTVGFNEKVIRVDGSQGV